MEPEWKWFGNIWWQIQDLHRWFENWKRKWIVATKCVYKHCGRSLCFTQICWGPWWPFWSWRLISEMSLCHWAHLMFHPIDPSGFGKVWWKRIWRINLCGDTSVPDMSRPLKITRQMPQINSSRKLRVWDLDSCLFWGELYLYGQLDI